MWHGAYSPLTADEVKAKFPHEDERGRYNTKLEIFRQPSMGARPNLCYTYRSPHGPVTNPHPSGWRISRERLAEMDARGEVIWREGKRPLRKSYAEKYKGKPIGTLWADIEIASGSEDVGYPTQKPLALLERIIAANSNPGDVVLDPFAGCATATGTGACVVTVPSSLSARIKLDPRPKANLLRAAFETHAPAVVSAHPPRPTPAIEGMQPTMVRREADEGDPFVDVLFKLRVNEKELARGHIVVLVLPKRTADPTPASVQLEDLDPVFRWITETAHRPSRAPTRALGGADEPDNWRSACRRCSLRKGPNLPTAARVDEWRQDSGRGTEINATHVNNVRVIGDHLMVTWNDSLVPPPSGLGLASPRWLSRLSAPRGPHHP